MYHCTYDAIAETIANCPTPHAFTLLVEEMNDNDCVQTFKTWRDSTGYNATVFVRSRYPNWGNGWRQLATATPPQEFDLPLVDGFVHYEPSTKSTYSKSQEGLVVVHFYCKKADGTDIVQNDTIAMLPEGFHPSANVHIPANVSFDGGSVYSQDVATTVADPTGRVWIAFPPAGCKAVTTTLVFYAAS